MGIFSGMKWYDYLWTPWTLGKAAYLAYKNLQPPKPGRVPQTSCYGKVLPLVWGKTRIAGNLIYQATEVYFDAGTYSTVTHGASIPALVAICEGEIAGIARAWRAGKLTALKYSTGTYKFVGTRPTQTAWSQLPSGKDIGYPGVAMVGNDWAAISGKIGDWSFEVQGFKHATGDASTGDADPVDVIEDALGASYYAANFTPTIVTATGVDGMAASSYARWVAAMALWVSPAWTEQKPATDHLRDLLESTWSDALWSDGSLKILPLGDQEVVGAVTFTPYTSVRYALTTADLVRDGDADPVEVERGAESDVYNTAPVAFLDRVPAGGADQAYNETTVEDSDPYHSQTYGIKRASRVVYDSVCLRDVAVKLARLRAQRWVQQRNTYSFSLPWRFCRLEPFDLVSVPVAGETKTVKILAVRESDDHATLEIQAEDWLAGANTANAHTVQSSDGTIDPMLDVQAQGHEKAATTWSPRTISGLSTSVVWHGGAQAFLSGGYGPSLRITDPAGQWTDTSSSPGLSAIGYKLASDGSSAVAVGDNATGTAGTAFYTTDGDTWTAATTAPSVALRAVISTGSGLFVGFYEDGAWYSDDGGVNWTAGTGFPSGTWADFATFGIAYNPDTGRVIALGYSTSGSVSSYSYSDDDGHTWSAAVNLSWATDGLAYGNGTFITADAIGGFIVSNDNGATWTRYGDGPTRTDATAESIVFTGRIFVAIGYSVAEGYTLRTSYSGADWSPRQALGFGVSMLRMAWGPVGGAIVGDGSIGEGEAYASNPVPFY